MSVEQLIVSKVIQDHSLVEATCLGIRPIFFQGEWEGIYTWVLEWDAKHGEVPTERAFKRAYGDVELDDASAETLSGLAAELVEQYQLRVLAETITEAMGPLDEGLIADALATLSQGVARATATTTRLRDFNIIEGWEARYQRYVEMREDPNALRGIPTGFAGLDRITHGLRPQQFIVLVGEQKRGKSLFELIMAMACHAHGLHPMLISFEMSVDEQLARFDALSAQVPYDRILSADLSDIELQRIKRQMIQRKNMQDFTMSEDSSSLTTLSALAGKVQEHLPDALYIDGIYLMDDENGEPKGTPQALTNISRGLKRLSQRFDIPVVGTSQVLPWKINNKRTRAITADAIGYTSSFAQDADLVLGVERDPNHDDQAIIRVVEARTAPRAMIFVRWDWVAMTFEEVDEPDEFDTPFV